MNNSAKKIKAPILIKIASSVWIVYGALFVVSAIVTSIPIFTSKPPSSEMESYAIWGIILVICICAYVFLHIGFQTLKGKSKDTLGNGIGSIIFSILGLFSVLQQTDPRHIDIVALIPGVILFVAGILALMSRTKYKDYASRKNA